MTLGIKKFKVLGAAARLGTCLCGVWLVCVFGFHPWEPIALDKQARTPRSPSTAEALTRFFWNIGAQSERSLTNLFWAPPDLPTMHVNSGMANRLPTLNWVYGVYSGRQIELSSWIYYSSGEWRTGAVLDTLANSAVISRAELATARRNGYHDWEILAEVWDESDPTTSVPGLVLEHFRAERRKAFNPFHGMIASAVPMVILFLSPFALGWAFKPLYGTPMRDHH